MIKKIESGSELLELVGENSEIQIIGTGWIGKLTYYYIWKYMQKKLQCVEIDKIATKKNISIIIALQEKLGEKLADKLSDNELENIFYLSNEVKNEMDTAVMLDYPAIYENEVLLSRKEELDEDMHSKFITEINSLLQKPSFPCFQSIEIETMNRCNGSCSFCPINRIDDRRPFFTMQTDLFKSIILQLSSMNYRGRVQLFSNNEPLLDKRIVHFAEYTWEHLPNACKVLFTNGTLLKMDMFLQLTQYLDIICIDIYYDDEIIDVMTNEMKEILKYCLANDNLQKKVMVQFINRKAIRNNRGGQSKNRQNVYQVKATCMLPYIQMIVRPDGMLSLCCNDALGQNTLGNLNVESLIEAWNNDNYRNMRSQIFQSRQNVDFCKYCDNYASINTVGNNVFSKEQLREAWNKVKSII